MSNSDTASPDSQTDRVRTRPKGRSHTGIATSSDDGKKQQRAAISPSAQYRRLGHAREKLTIAEVCAELKVSRSTFYYWRQIGKAPRCLVLPNREVRVYRSDLDDWLDACSEEEA